MKMKKVAIVLDVPVIGIGDVDLVADALLSNAGKAVAVDGPQETVVLALVAVADALRKEIVDAMVKARAKAVAIFAAAMEIVDATGTGIAIVVHARNRHPRLLD